MNKYVLLDRDGTIIVNKHYQKDPAITELIPNAREGLDKLRRAGFKLVVTSNQSGIARGYMTSADVDAVNQSMVRLLGGGDDYFAGMYYCPHVTADDCRCRKPGPGLAETAGAELGFSPEDAYVVGDRDADIEFGAGVGATTVLVRTGYGAATEREGKVSPDWIADDLLAAAEWILSREGVREGVKS